MKAILKFILTFFQCWLFGIPYKKGLYIGWGGAFYQQ